MTLLKKRGILLLYLVFAYFISVVKSTIFTWFGSIVVFHIHILIGLFLAHIKNRLKLNAIHNVIIAITLTTLNDFFINF